MHISRVSADNTLMSKSLFSETIKIICRMASTDLINAALETDFMEILYTENQIESLESAIDVIS